MGSNIESVHPDTMMSYSCFNILFLMFILGVSSNNYLKSPTQNQWTSDAGQVVVGKQQCYSPISKFNFPLKRSFSSIRIRNDDVSKLGNAYKILQILRKIVESSKEDQILRN